MMQRLIVSAVRDRKGMTVMVLRACAVRPIAVSKFGDSLSRDFTDVKVQIQGKPTITCYKVFCVVD